MLPILKALSSRPFCVVEANHCFCVHNPHFATKHNTSTTTRNKKNIKMSEPDASKQKPFPFMDLPVEIRRKIWKECLPSRVMEIDGVLWNRTRICHLVYSGRINRKLPAITHVCAESRAVVSENGRWEPMTGPRGKVWWNPERDLVFQHWRPLDNLIMWGEYDDLAPDLLKYNGRCRGLGVIAQRICPFFPSGNCTRDTQLQVPEWSCDEIGQFRQSRDWWISMDMVVLHVSEEAARQSGLFGLLGDAPVQLVDVNDTKRIAQFQEFSASASPAEDADTREFFSRLGEFQERVRVWSEALESVWVYNDWYKAFINNFEGVHQPWDIWLGPVHKPRKPRPNKLRLSDLAAPDPNPINAPDNIDLSRFWLNRDHPFVKESLAAFPRFHLQLMFRRCPGDCYLDKNWDVLGYKICRGDTDGCAHPTHPHLYRLRRYY